MIHLKIFDSSHPAMDVVAERFPFRMGRASNCDLCLSAPGVWNQHAEIQLEPEDGFHVSAVGEAILTVNDQPAVAVRLRSGDVLGLGSVRVQFGLGAAPGRSWRFREFLIWAGLAALSLGEVMLIYWLPG